MNILPQFVIVSAFDTQFDLNSNLKRSNSLLSDIYDLGLKAHKADSYEKNSVVISWVVFIKEYSDMVKIKDLAIQKYNQDAILYVDSNRGAHLVNDNTKFIGRFKATSKETATTKKVYTEFNGGFYHVA